MNLPFTSGGEKTIRDGSLQIKIVYMSQIGLFKKYFEKIISDVVLRDPRARAFNHITIILQDEQKHPKGVEALQQLFQNPSGLGKYGQVLNEEVVTIEKGGLSHRQAIIHVFVDTMIFGVIERHAPELLSKGTFMTQANVHKAQACILQNLPGLFTSNFNHELTHALHFLRKNFAARAEKALAKRTLIQQRVSKSMSNLAVASDYGQLLSDYRSIVESCLLRTYTEGVALYYQAVLGNAAFLSQSNVFKGLYDQAEGPASQFFTFLKNFTGYLNPRVINDPSLHSRFLSIVIDLLKQAEKIAYPLGVHMAYSIETTFHLEDKLLDITPGEFIRLYEKACEMHGLQPLVSLSSGKGKLFDYKEILRILYRAERARLG